MQPEDFQNAYACLPRPYYCCKWGATLPSHINFSQLLYDLLSTLHCMLTSQEAGEVAKLGLFFFFLFILWYRILWQRLLLWFACKRKQTSGKEKHIWPLYFPINAWRRFAALLFCCGHSGLMAVAMVRKENSYIRCQLRAAWKETEDPPSTSHH